MMQYIFRSKLYLEYIITVLFNIIESGTGTHESRLAYPHVAFLSNEEAGVHCHGSILTDRIILTAALCLRGAQNASDLLVVVGDKTLGETYKRMQVSSWVLHPEYSQRNFQNNIALLLLRNWVKLSDQVKKVVLSDAVPETGTVGYVAGYAITKVGPWSSSISLTFQIIREQIQSPESCRAVFPFIKMNEFCTDFHNNPQVFRGESGSALVVRGYEQIGIQSYAMEKTRKSAFSVFNPIYVYRKWIEDNVIQLLDIEC